MARGESGSCRRILKFERGERGEEHHHLRSSTSNLEPRVGRHVVGIDPIEEAKILSFFLHAHSAAESVPLASIFV